MNGALQRLRAEIGSDLRAFEGRVEELSHLDLLATQDEARLAQAAVALHHAYGAVEAALTRVARCFEGTLPSGSDWHQELLLTTSLEIPGIRPAVLSQGSLAGLRSLLGFRHFFRHAYALAWDANRLDSLKQDAIALLPELRRDFAQLDTLLAKLANSSGDERATP